MSTATDQGGRKRRGYGQGHIYKRGSRWWIQYRANGRRVRESSGTSETEARRLLKARLHEIAAGRYVGPEQERTTVGDLLDALEVHLEARGAKAMVSLRSHLKPVRKRFGGIKAVALSAAQVERFARDQLAAGKARATVNRQVGALKQALNLARKQRRLREIPYIPRLHEDNARQGFFERADFERVAKHLPEPVDDIARFGYLTGWRKGEILPLRWEQVDREGREIRLATSKNRRGRVLPIDGELAELLLRRWRRREFTTSDNTSHLSEYVFHRRGRPLVDFRKVWVTACDAAGVPGKLFHDLRRTAARDMVRSGVPEAVAMAITGHRTRSMFQRYNITSGDDMRDALRRTDAYREQVPGSASDGGATNVKAFRSRADHEGKAR